MHRSHSKLISLPRYTALHCLIGCLACQSHWVCVQMQVIVATAPMCWGMSIAAHLVVIMGTQYYDGAHSQGADDYPVTDLLQMMGRASRPDIDDSGKWVLLRSPTLLCLSAFLNVVMSVLVFHSMASAAVLAAKAGLCVWTHSTVSTPPVPLLSVLMPLHDMFVLLKALWLSPCMHMLTPSITPLTPVPPPSPSPHSIHSPNHPPTHCFNPPTTFPPLSLLLPCFLPCPLPYHLPQPLPDSPVTLLQKLLLQLQVLPLFFLKALLP